MFRSYVYNTLLYKKSGVVYQLIRYGLVSLVAFAIDFSTFHLLTNVLMINYLISNTVSFIFGLFTDYFMSRNWVFKNKKHRFERDFALFSVVGVIGLGLSNLILFMLLNYRVLNVLLKTLNGKLIKDIAKAIATFIVFFWNFTARKIFVFSSKA